MAVLVVPQPIAYLPFAPEETSKTEHFRYYFVNFSFAHIRILSQVVCVRVVLANEANKLIFARARSETEERAIACRHIGRDALLHRRTCIVEILCRQAVHGTNRCARVLSMVYCIYSTYKYIL